MKQKKITNLFLALLLLLISIFAPNVSAMAEGPPLETAIFNGTNGFNISWDAIPGDDALVIVYTNNSSLTSVNEGYKYFYDNVAASSNFSGPLLRGLEYNEDYTSRMFDGFGSLKKVIRTIEDGVYLTYMDNRTHLPSSFFSVDTTSKVNGTNSIKMSNPTISTDSIYGIRHFESDYSLDVFSIHCRINNQSGTTDKVLGMTPYCRDYILKNISYCFDSYINGSWTNPDLIVDGAINTWGEADCVWATGATQLLNGNNCSGFSLGRLSKVELRAMIGYNAIANPKIIIRPVMSNGLDGNDHEYTATVDYSLGGAWTPWINITNDDNAPVWTWNSIENLDCELESNCTGAGSVLCSKVEIRVSYYQGYTLYPDVVFHDNGAANGVTANGSSLLASWVTDRVYNVTWSRYPDAVNVTIDDHHGNTSYVNSSSTASYVDGFVVSMDRGAKRDAYLDNWNEVDCTSTFRGYFPSYNSTYPDVPSNFTALEGFSTLVHLSWNASNDWDQVSIRKNNTDYPNSSTSGANASLGPGTSANDSVIPTEITYYSAFGYENETGLSSVNFITGRYTSSQLRAFFSYSPSLAKQGDQIHFSDLSSGDIISWIWDFGDGHTSLGKNQVHTFDTPGRYTISLKIIDAGSNSDTYSKSISIATFEEPTIPPPVEPIYPDGHSVSDMYNVLKVSDLPVSDNKIRIVLIDTGFTPRIYEDVDLSKISGYSLPRFSTIYDENGHGTFVSYEIAHIIQSKCPNSDLMSFKAFDKYGAATPEDFLEALDAVKEMRPDIVTISAGTIGNPNDQYSKKIQELREAGIIVVAAAAGNLGPSSSTILSPACSDYAIAVGSFDMRGTIDTSDDTICTWSSRGPVLDISPKPDIVAPGESIIGPWLSGERVSSGTSMSTPLIAGGTALVVANNKQLVDTVRVLYCWNLGVIGDAYENALKDGSISKGEQNAWGAGIPDFTKVNDNFRMNLLVLIFLPIVLIISIVSVSAVVLYKRREGDGTSW